MICGKCGKKLPEEARFCVKCGTKLDVVVEDVIQSIPEVPEGAKATPERESIGKIPVPTDRKPLKQPNDRGYGLGYVKVARIFAVILSLAIFISGCVLANHNLERWQSTRYDFIFLGILLAIIVYVFIDLNIRQFENIALTAKHTAETNFLLRRIASKLYEDEEKSNESNEEG